MAGVYCDERAEAALAKLGARDRETLVLPAVLRLEAGIKASVGPDRCGIDVTAPGSATSSACGSKTTTSFWPIAMPPP